MSSRFETALERNTAPQRLGDVSLRYDTSLLIGEADRPKRSNVPQWLRGSSYGLLAVAALASLGTIETWKIGLGVLPAAGLYALAYLLERREVRQRRFVLNFASNSLRLDFSTPFAFRARTLLVHFDGVKAVQLFEQGDGRMALTVDFLSAPGSETLLREVLVAHVSDAQLEQVVRLQRLLQGAFGLGAPDVPAADAGVDTPTDTFSESKTHPPRHR